MIFKFPPYSVKFKKHYNGVIAILTHDNLEGKIKLGVNMDNKVWRLEKFRWRNVNYDSDGHDSENNNNNEEENNEELYKGPSGLINFIFDRCLCDVELLSSCMEVLKKLVEDVLHENSLKWIPDAKYYTFIGSDLCVDWFDKEN